MATAVFDIRGDVRQTELVRSALAVCDFPWELLEPSLRAEGRSAVTVTFDDLSRFQVAGADHGQAHDHADGAHTIEREIEGRRAVLGLFYLPPHTKIVLERRLVDHPDLLREVFVAEAAHLVDYHWIVPARPTARAAIWNALHADHHDVDPGAVLPESGDIGHGHSWFDGPAGYATWVGEALMEAFARAFAPSVPVTMSMAHPTSAAAAAEIRAALLAGTVFRGRSSSRVFHDAHRRIRRGQVFPDAATAAASGLKPCRVCRPV